MINNKPELTITRVDYQHMLTVTKREKINNILSIEKSDKNYYAIHHDNNIPKNFTKVIDAITKIHYFKHNYFIDNEFKHECFKRSKQLTIITEDKKITITKMRSYMTKEYLGQLRARNHKLVKKFYENAARLQIFNITYIYINVEIETLNSSEIDTTSHLINRIEMDIAYDVLNLDEIEKFTGKSISNILTFNHVLMNIDYWDIFVGGKLNEQFDITFDDNHTNEHHKLYDLLYTKYYGYHATWNSSEIFLLKKDNEFLIIDCSKTNDKQILIKCRMYGDYSFIATWNKLNDVVKAKILYKCVV